MNSSIFNFSNVQRFLGTKILLWLLIVIAASGLIQRGFHVHATQADSNIASILIRLEALRSARPDFSALIGSSITAKLAASELQSGLQRDIGLLNVGIDGGSPLYGASKILEASIRDSLAIIEVNSMLKPAYGANTYTVESIFGGLKSRLSASAAFLRYENRPTTVLYSALKTYSDRRYDAISFENLDLSSIAVQLFHGGSSWTDGLTERELAVVEDWNVVLTELRENSNGIILVLYPDGRADRAEELAFARKLAARYKLPLIDLKASLSQENLVYSDGLHMTTDTAREVSKLLGRIIGANQLY